MHKTLQEIQQENREIIVASLGEIEQALEEFTKRRLTLSRVLLALSKQDWWRFGYPLVMGFDGAFCEVWHSDLGTHFSEKFQWDLTKETLEEQPEETQIAINNLLRV